MYSNWLRSWFSCGVITAIGVSGGSDSMALCVLAAMWKRDGYCGIDVNQSNGFVDGLMAVVVDHGLRVESKDEANLVCSRVRNMGMVNFSSVRRF